MEHSASQDTKDETTRCADCGSNEIVEDSTYIMPLCQDCLNEREEYTCEMISEQAKNGIFDKESSVLSLEE